jgi:uncharacterized membrane protein required for colicin V production
MVELSILVWMLAAFFGYIGWKRGWTKELIALAGIVLGLFALYQFDTLLRVTLFGDLPRSQVFYIQSTIFIVIIFFAYHSRAIGDSRPASGSRGREERDETQSRALGGIVGFINGYLIGGTLWYFLDVAGYPIAPLVVAPTVGTASAEAARNLPLYVLTQNGANGDLLSLLVVVLFIVVLVMI